MASAKDYQVSFPYGAKDGRFYGPKGSIGPYHRGNDRACPNGTPVVIAGIQIGLTGKSGAAAGYHLHTQAGTDVACQKDVNPSPYEFQPGIVVATGEGKTWGKFVTVQVGSRFISYCHLSAITVSKGKALVLPPPPKPPVSSHRYGWTKGRVLELNPRDGKWRFYKPGTRIVAAQFTGLKGERWKILGPGLIGNNSVMVNSARAGGNAEVCIASALGVEYAGEFRII